MGLRFYYETQFPYDLLYRYLTCDGFYPMAHRELAMRWDADVFKRYETFESAKDCLSHMKQMRYAEEHVRGVVKVPMRFGSMDVLKAYLLRRLPVCIDAGPIFESIYTQHLDRKDTYTVKPCPLVFDIDIKDYDGQRPCACTGKASCDACWAACMRPALIDLVHFMRAFMGFARVIPIFSGRCGVHVLVFDQRVWTWDDSARMALVGYLPKSIKVDVGAMRSDHLLKIPFSPHAFTGNLALPILNMETFLPSRDAVNVKNVGDIGIYLEEWRKIAC
jgi:DNA primase catalytic subunit